MKLHYIALFLFVTTSSFAQKSTFNIQKGAVAKGYDVVAYFSNQAIEGRKNIATVYQGATFRFSSEENKTQFLANPTKYIPAYGGYCAYAMGKNGDKVTINPETFEIRNQRLYLFYNAWGTNTFALWQKEGPEKLRILADAQWKKSTAKN